MGTLIRNLSMLLAAACFAATAAADEPQPAKPPADSMLGTKAGQVRDDNGLNMKFVWCLPGTFTMGDADSKEKPRVFPNAAPEFAPVQVLLMRGYWLGKFEVTQSEWRQLMATEPWRGQESTKAGNDFPATFVNWEDAASFCQKFTELERTAGRLPAGCEYTLPTEAQWERACRAQTQKTFSFGDDLSKLDEYAWYKNNAWDVGEKFAHPVGLKKANPWGLHDMHGNVWEWCRDWHTPSQSPVPADFRLPGGRDPEVTEPIKDADNKVLRGGGWDFDAVCCRAAARDMLYRLNGNRYAGFRVALTPVRPAAENPAK